MKEPGEEGEDQKGEARVALANDEGFPHLGEVDFIDNQVNPDTGTIEVRNSLGDQVPIGAFATESYLTT